MAVLGYTSRKYWQVPSSTGEPSLYFLSEGVKIHWILYHLTLKSRHENIGLQGLAAQKL